MTEDQAQFISFDGSPSTPSSRIFLNVKYICEALYEHRINQKEEKYHWLEITVNNGKHPFKYGITGQQAFDIAEILRKNFAIQPTTDSQT